MTDLDGLGHVLDMLGECNGYGAVTISGIGPSSSRVTVTTSAPGRGVHLASGPTLTVALESLRRKVRRSARAVRHD